MTRRLPNELRALQASLTETVKQARLAYRFSPGSYTHSALNACLQTGKNFRAVVDATLSPQTAGLDAAQRLERDAALEPEDQPRPSKAALATRWNGKRDRRCGGHWGQPQINTGFRCANSFPVPMRRGNPATVKRDKGQCMSLSACDGRENVTRNGIARCRV